MSAGSYPQLLIEDHGRIRRITINRPQKLNALNAEVMRELKAAFAEAVAAPGVGGIVLTGAGEKAFVAGADIAELSEKTPLSGKETTIAGQAVFGEIEASPKPVLAAVNGYALGGGLELALACHLRIASPNAKLGLPEVKLGIIPGYGGTQRLPRLLGSARALWLILSGEPIDAAEAERIGLVNRVVPQPELARTADQMLETILARGPIAVRCALEAVRRGLDTTLAEGLKIEADLFSILCTTHDMREGMTAFLEKREAKFQGR